MRIKPKLGPCAHGAIVPSEFHEAPAGDIDKISIGSSLPTADDPPVWFYGLENIKKIRDWLNTVIEYLEES